MALTITFQHQNYIPKGPSIRVASAVPASSDYPTNGYPVGIAQLQFGTDVSMLIPQITGAFIAEWDKANDKVIIRAAAAGTEVAGSFDLSGEVLYFFAIGY